jgi:cell wall-associated NlpC family hydrolase
LKITTLKIVGAMLAIVAALLNSGCASSGGQNQAPVQTTTGLPYYPPGSVAMTELPAGYSVTQTSSGGSVVLQTFPLSAMAVAAGTEPWRVAANGWIGTPYKARGSDHSGIDCSGYACELYEEVAHKKLPRSSRELFTQGAALGIGTLKPGDLVFFDTTDPDEVTHVGVSLGGRDFTHASTAKGVMISSLDDPYWHRRFAGARRVLLRQ